MENSLRIAIVREISTTSYKLSPEFYIYTTEALALYEAVKYTIKNKEITHKNYLILSDYLSSLIYIHNSTNPTNVSKLIQEKIYEAGKKK